MKHTNDLYLNVYMHVLREAEVKVFESSDDSFRLGGTTPEILAVEAGKVEVLLNGQTYPVSSGQLMFFGPGESAVVSHMGDSPSRLYHTRFEAYKLVEKTGDSLVFRVNHEKLPKRGWVSGMLPIRVFSLLKMLTESHAAAKEAAQDGCVIQELLSISCQRSEALSELSEDTLRNALSFIHRYYDAEISRSHMAQLTGFHPRYFSALFKKQTGWSFSEYLARFRVNKAKEYLLTDQYTLDEIAQKVGYADGAYLSKKFRKVTGMSPTDFRKQKPNE